jgi:uncharacterized protein YdeI (YjbR/CyaY-like superfamily)
MASPQKKTFTALLERDGTALNWIIARVPFDLAKIWPRRIGRRVRGSIGGFDFRTTLVSYPHGGGPVLIVNKKMLAGTRVRVGERIRITLEPDLEERPVIVPPELARELRSDRRLQRWFDALSESARREIGKWADDAKSPDARRNRARKIAERLMQAMEGEEDPPPILRAAFQRQPLARDGWFALTPVQRRGHLLGIFYYETADARERRAAKAIDHALRAARKRSGKSASGTTV